MRDELAPQPSTAATWLVRCHGVPVVGMESDLGHAEAALVAIRDQLDAGSTHRSGDRRDHPSPGEVPVGPTSASGGLRLMSDNTAPMYRPAEIAARCQVSTRTVMRAIRSGRLRASRLGSRGAYRVRPEDLEAWIIGTTVLPPPRPERPEAPVMPGQLRVTEEMGRHGHRAPPATP